MVGMPAPRIGFETRLEIHVLAGALVILSKLAPVFFSKKIGKSTLTRYGCHRRGAWAIMGANL